MSYNKNCGKPDNTSVRFDHATGKLLMWDGYRFVAVNPAVPQPAFTAQLLVAAGATAPTPPFNVPFTDANFEASVTLPAGVWSTSDSQVGIPRDGLYRISYQLNITNTSTVTAASAETTLLVNDNTFSSPDFPTNQSLGPSQQLSFNGNRLAQLKVGDLIALRITPSANVVWDHVVINFKLIN